MDDPSSLTSDELISLIISERMAGAAENAKLAESISKLKRVDGSTTQTSLSRLDPEVIKGSYMMSKDKRTHTKSFSLRIHQPPATVREALTRTDILSSFRVSVLQEINIDEFIVHWNFMVNTHKCCELCLFCYDNGDDSFVAFARGPTIVRSLGMKDSATIDKLFYKIGNTIYDKFKQEDVIDTRVEEDFIESIPYAPPQTKLEKTLVKKSMDRAEELLKTAKRVAGSAIDPVEKFVGRENGKSTGWGITVAKMDVSAVALFARLWLCDSYKTKAKLRGLPIREVWYGLDGTRGLQYSRSFSLPGGFNDRLLELWMTWVAEENEGGGRTFIIANTDIEDYGGTRNKVSDEKMTRASSRGVIIIKELTENTCEWTRVQQVDLKFTKVMPSSVLDFLIKQHLGWANEMQEQFRRNGKRVDRERLVALSEVMRRRRGKPLHADQERVFTECMRLFGETGDEGWKLKVLGWKAIESPCPDTDMWIKYNPPKKGERQVATGKATGILDCSAEEGAAWAMDYCSNERRRINTVEGDDLARLELRNRARENEMALATVKNMPFPLNNREFVARQFWKTEEGKVWLAVESIDDEVDYGVKLKMTRGLIRSIWLLEDLPVRGGAKQCKLTLIQQLDAGGFVPAWVVNKKIPEGLNTVQEAIEEFRQDEKIDAAEQLDLATSIRESWRTEVYSDEEELLLNRMKEQLGEGLNEGWKHLHSPDPFVVMDIIRHGDSAATGRAVTIVDAHLEDALAWELCRMTRSKMKLNRANGQLDRAIVKVNNHSDISYSVLDLEVPGFSPREFCVKSVWKFANDGQTCLVGLEDVDCEEFPLAAAKLKKWIRAKTATFWKYERLPEVEGVPQTMVTYYQQADLKGFIPLWVGTSAITHTLSHLCTMRKTLDRSDEIDALDRLILIERIKREELLSREMGEEAKKKVEALLKERPESERPPASFGLADSKMLVETSRGCVWGKSTVKVRAGLEEVAASFWDFGSRANMAISGDIDRSFEEEGGEGMKMLVRRRQSIHGGRVGFCTFTSKMELKKVEDGDTIIILVSSLGDEEVYNRNTVRARGSVSDGSDGSVEAKESVAIRLKRIPGKTEITELEYACDIEIGFGSSSTANTKFIMRRLEEVSGTSIYFQRRVTGEDFGSEDGQALGHDLLWKASSSKKRLENLVEVVGESRALKMLIEEIPFVRNLLEAALRGRLTMNRAVGTRLICISEKESLQIGKNLIPSLKSKKLIGAGIDQWKRQNQAVKELMETHEWFEPMAVVLGKGIVRTAAWGLMWRVFIGATLSVTDLATDLLVLKQFWDGGEAMVRYRDSSIASLSASICLQLFIVIVQNRKIGAVRVLKEMSVVVLGMKAPYDAYRVAIGSEQEKDALLDPFSEMTCIKCAEIVPAEMVPRRKMEGEGGEGESLENEFREVQEGETYAEEEKEVDDDERTGGLTRMKSMLLNNKVKVTPVGPVGVGDGEEAEGEDEFDESEFKREIKRRGSLKL
ncbi:hypothetical protein TrLO_g2562 [Triparma laevis f. longispina]|uniref:START domain-containing protein n=1 Tax=Triparma laevis f. longispina TaxID=1714387 RepID=A0A9W7AUW4_9STRA|nr:hypothetical protein TrLO_g2562 [Triparma laevis f. longispina]